MKNIPKKNVKQRDIKISPKIGKYRNDFTAAKLMPTAIHATDGGKEL